MEKHPIPGDEINKGGETGLSQDTLEGLSYENIMTEYRYADVTKHDAKNKSLESALLDGHAPVQEEEPEEPGPYAGLEPDDQADTRDLFPAAAAAAAEAEPSGPQIHTEEAQLGGTERFDRIFAPKDTFAGAEADMGPERPAETGGRPFFARWAEKLKEAPPKEALTPEEAAGQAKKQVGSFRFRALIAFILLLPLVFISVAQPYGILPGFLKYAERPYLVLLIMVLLQMLIMLCGMDLLAKGATDLFRLRPGVETLLALSCFASLLNVFSIADPFSLFTSPQAIAFLPYCAVSGAAVFFALWGEIHRAQGYLRAYKTAAMAGETPDTVVLEQKLWDGQPGFARHKAPAADFAEQTEQPDIVMKFSKFITPLLLVLCFVLAWLSALRHDGAVYFFWAFSALCCAAVPLTAFGAYTAVFSRIASRLAHMGAAIAGWPAAVQMSRAHVMVVQDHDLFPPGTLTLRGLKAFPPFTAVQVVSYTSALLAASGSSLNNAMEAAASRQEIIPSSVKNFAAYDGGFSGEVDGSHLYLGTLNFMHSMGIDIPAGYAIKKAVFVTVNLAVAGVFPIEYTASKTVEGAMLLLEQQKIPSVLAVRDFNVTPDMLGEKYGVIPDMFDFPVIEDRFALSDKDRDYIGRPSAVLAKDGLCPYAEAIVGGKRLHKVTLTNLIIHTLTLIIGILVTFYFTHQTTVPGDAAWAVNPQNLLGFMLIWWLIQWVVSVFSNRY